MGLVETRREPTISVSLAMISSRESIGKHGEWIIENLESGRFQFSIIHYQFSKLQMTAAGNQDMAPGEHTSFITGQKCDRAGDIFRIEMLFQRPSFLHSLPIH